MKEIKPRLLQRIRDVKVGEGVEIDDFVNLYECMIGEGSRISAFVEIGKGVTVGRRCHICSHAYICPGVTIGDDVFVGEAVTFINDKYARATNAAGAPATEADWTLRPTTVKNGAYIGARTVILCDVTIGNQCRIAPGSVVTHDVPDGATVAGNPASIVGVVLDE